ncbi:hypothetical protein BH10PLA2_BH10PLA2_09930 [soil metagenome]
MFKRAGMGVLALSLFLGAALTTAPAQDKTQTKTKTVLAKTVEGELVSLDVKKLTAVVKTDSGNQTVTLGKDIKVVGPRDGARKDGLDDDDLDPGAKVRFTIAANNRTATQLKILAAAPNPPAKTTPPVVNKTTTENKSTTITKGGTTRATKSTTTKKTEVKGPSGKIVKVDVSSKTFTIADDAGKRTDFTFDSATQFFGPRGGQGDKNGKDDRFVVGAPVHLVLGVSSKTVKEVHLPFRSAIGK